MAVFTIYTRRNCSFCDKAKILLTQLGQLYSEHDVTIPAEREAMMARVPTAKTVPQIFLSDHHIGGYEELNRLNRSGSLESLIEVYS